MIHALKVVSLLPYSVVWFPDEEDVTQVRRLRSPVMVIRQGSPEFLRRFEDRVVSSRPFCTAGTDLAQDEDRLLANMNSTCRSQMRKGLRLDHGFAAGPPSRLPAGRRVLNDFNKRKFGQPVSENNWRLIEASGCLTQIVHGGEVMAAHVYLVDGTRRARFFVGATVPREGGEHDRQLIAYLHRALHWRDMLHFKRLGVRLYDLGGLFDDPDHPSAGIDRFKLSFGLQKFYEYHALASPYRVVRSGLRHLGGRP